MDNRDQKNRIGGMTKFNEFFFLSFDTNPLTTRGLLLANSYVNEIKCKNDVIFRPYLNETYHDIQCITQA